MRIPVTKKIDSKNRVVIPKEAMAALKLKAGDDVMFSVDKGRIIILKHSKIV